MFNTVRIALDSFAGINKAKVRKVQFLFDQSLTGSILISDLAFVNEKCGSFSAAFGHHIGLGSGYPVQFNDTLTASIGDTLLWTWHFGDPTSGTHDTSSSHNPLHLYTAPGTYTVCLYVQSKRTNGRACTDTVCAAVVVAHTAVPNIAGEQIDIFLIQPTMYCISQARRLPISCNCKICMGKQCLPHLSRRPQCTCLRRWPMACTWASSAPRKALCIKKW
jgi:hypothetical protein